MTAVLPDVPDRLAGAPASLGHYEGFEVYAMPAYVRFPVPDPSEAARWYVDAFGFGAMYSAPEVDGVPMLVHLRRRMFQDVLVVVNGTERAGTVCLDATGELDDIVQRASAFLGRRLEPVRRLWGTLDLIVDDPWGNRVTFFSAPDRPSGTIDDAMDETAEHFRSRTSRPLL